MIISLGKLRQFFSEDFFSLSRISTFVISIAILKKLSAFKSLSSEKLKLFVHNYYCEKKTDFLIKML